jgi:hypothetical protein
LVAAAAGILGGTLVWAETLWFLDFRPMVAI